MKHINFIPQELTPKKRFEELRTPFTLHIILLVLSLWTLFFAVHLSRMMKLAGYNSQIERKMASYRSAERNLEAIKETLQRIEVQAQELDKKSSKLSKKIRYLTQASMKEIDLAGMLTDVNNLLPLRMWLNELEFEGTEIRMKGGTFNNKLVSDFMDNLNKSPYFTGASFVYTEKEELAGKTVVGFEITARMVAGR